MKKIKIIVIGVGPRGINWLKVIKRSSIVELLGVCDLEQKTKQKLKLLIKKNHLFNADYHLLYPIP